MYVVCTCAVHMVGCVPVHGMIGDLIMSGHTEPVIVATDLIMRCTMEGHCQLLCTDSPCGADGVCVRGLTILG